MRTRVLKYFVGLLILCVWTSCTKDSVFWHNGYYQGEMLDGYPEGYGQYVSVSGDKQYQGTWKRVFRMVMVFICMEILVTRVLSEKDFLMVRDFCA